MAIHHHRRHIMHGVSRAKPRKKNVGITIHSRAGMHQHRQQLPGFARQDAWKRQAEAQGQG